MVSKLISKEKRSPKKSRQIIVVDWDWLILKSPLIFGIIFGAGLVIFVYWILY